MPPVKGVEFSTGQTPHSSTVDTGTHRCARTDTQTQTRTQADTDTHKNTRTHMRTHTLTLTLTLLWFVIFVVILELRIRCCIVISKSCQHTFTYKHISSNLLYLALLIIIYFNYVPHNISQFDAEMHTNMAHNNVSHGQTFNRYKC